ncbi:tyrosine-type recombinase/integrase [Leptolyngbya sp. FACHB-261]|nr:tyrosine-type recombinase/integrase [Leptolyngbya sp. FACHB-261]
MQPQSPLFLTQGPNSQGQRVTYRVVYHLFVQLQKASGLEAVSLHRLRHTFATKLLLRGMESKHAIALTRHREGNLTAFCQASDSDRASVL